jgi:hypothetical protein
MLYKLKVVSEYRMELSESEYEQLCECAYPEAFLREENLVAEEIESIDVVRY